MEGFLEKAANPPSFKILSDVQEVEFQQEYAHRHMYLFSQYITKKAEGGETKMKWQHVKNQEMIEKQT